MNKAMFKDFLIRIKLLFNFGLIEFKYLDLYSNKLLMQYIDDKATALANEEDVLIKYVTYQKLNEKAVPGHEAVGIFRYIPKNVGIPFRQIELCEHADVWTKLHELGHYFINKRNEIQTEEKADMYIKEFFDAYLPPFFTWIFQISLEVRCKVPRKYTSIESYKYIKEYEKFMKTELKEIK